MSISTTEFMAMEQRLANKIKMHKDFVGNLEYSEPHEGRESELHLLIKQECSRRQWLCFMGATHKRAWRPLGEPDALVYADGGRCFLIECKTAKGKLRPEQIGVAMLAERLGHKVHLIRSFSEFLNLVDNREQPAKIETL